MERPGFTFGWSLGLLEMVGTCVFSALERAFYSDSSSKGKIVMPMDRSNNLIDYTIVIVCLMASSSLSTIALNYINFPTKVQQPHALLSSNHEIIVKKKKKAHLVVMTALAPRAHRLCSSRASSFRPC